MQIIHWTNDHYNWYHRVYLKSDHWKDLRARKLAANPTCQNCGSTDNLECHHLRYKQLFDVEIHDLRTLCPACHRLTHQKEGLPRRSRAPLRKSQQAFPQPAHDKIVSRLLEQYHRRRDHIARNTQLGRKVLPTMLKSTNNLRQQLEAFGVKFSDN